MDLKSLRYLESHEWAYPEGEVVTIGVSRFAVDQLTDVTFLELPKVGRQLRAGEEFGVIESVKSTSPLYSPVAGEIIAVNDAAVKDTALVNEDPYLKGWLLKVKLAPGATLDHLKSSAEYEKQIADSH